MSQHATTTDMADLGLPAQALVGVSTAIQNRHLTLASGVIDSYLRGRYKLPLSSPYPDEIVAACVAMAGYKLLKRRGYNPGEYDEQFKADHDATIEWLVRIANGSANLDASADASPSTHEARPAVYSSGAPYVNDETEDDEPMGW